MGPEATAELYKRIIRICQTEYGAKYDSDFPPIFIYNMPLPDIVEEKGGINLIEATIADGIDKLEKAGCDFISVPCNTVFAYMKEKRLEFLDIIKITADYVRSNGLKKVGLIATRTTIKNGLYESALDGIDVIQLPEVLQFEVNEIIMRILSGEKNYEDKQTLLTCAKSLAKSGAEAVILGCTDLPILITPKDSEILLVDSLQALAEVTVKKAVML